MNNNCLIGNERICLSVIDFSGDKSLKVILYFFMNLFDYMLYISRIISNVQYIYILRVTEKERESESQTGGQRELEISFIIFWHIKIGQKTEKFFVWNDVSVKIKKWRASHFFKLRNDEALI